MGDEEVPAGKVRHNLQALDASAHGVWQVTTEVSIYLIDLDRRIAMRIPGAGGDPHVAPDGAFVIVNQVRGDREWMPIDQVVACRVGDPLVLACTAPDGHPYLRWSTYVQAIRPANANQDST